MKKNKKRNGGKYRGDGRVQMKMLIIKQQNPNECVANRKIIKIEAPFLHLSALCRTAGHAVPLWMPHYVFPEQILLIIVMSF